MGPSHLRKRKAREDTNAISIQSPFYRLRGSMNCNFSGLFYERLVHDDCAGDTQVVSWYAYNESRSVPRRFYTLPPTLSAQPTAQCLSLDSAAVGDASSRPHACTLTGGSQQPVPYRKCYMKPPKDYGRVFCDGMEPGGEFL